MARTPVGSSARARLREAQAAEGRALAAVESADRSLAHRRESVHARITALEETVDDASQNVLKERRRLVEVSGLDRAALLLGLTPKELKRSLSQLEEEHASEEVQAHN